MGLSNDTNNRGLWGQLPSINRVQYADNHNQRQQLFQHSMIFAQLLNKQSIISQSPHIQLLQSDCCSDNIFFMQSQDSQSNSSINFPDQANLISTISGGRDSQPTKAKVTAFKARVLKLITLYAEKSHSLGPLLKSISQQAFMRQPEKLNMIVSQSLNKPNIDETSLMELLQMYKILLLFKAKTKDKCELFSENFVKILRRVNEQGANTVNQMLETAIIQRKSHLNINFFQYLTRKLPQLKPTLIEKCQQIEDNNQMRPAQLKQLQKLKSKLGKKQPNIKKQQIE